MTRPQIISMINQLQIPARARDLLIRICHISADIAESILRFVQRHPGLELIAVALAVGWLLSHLPLLGALLGAAIVFTACILALLRELETVLGVGGRNRRQ